MNCSYMYPIRIEGAHVTRNRRFTRESHVFVIKIQINKAILSASVSKLYIVADDARTHTIIHITHVCHNHFRLLKNII